MKECSQCLHENHCTPFEKQLDDCSCKNFISIDFELDCSTNWNANWKEFSWNKYTDTLLDYGEMSEWDLFLLEEQL